MAFSRQVAPETALEGAPLDAAMAGIGLRFAVVPDHRANIEDTVLAASFLGADVGDLRVLSVLATWLGVHHERLNADRLVRLVREYPSSRVHAFWATAARWLKADRRFAKLHKWSDERLDLLPFGTDFQLKRRGEDARFVEGPLRIPEGTLRERGEDVLSPPELARNHPAYRYRILMGPSYRADMWALLEEEPDLSAAELARRTYGSFATAWHAKRDFELLRSSTVSGRAPGQPVLRAPRNKA